MLIGIIEKQGQLLIDAKKQPLFNIDEIFKRIYRFKFTIFKTPYRHYFSYEYCDLIKYEEKLASYNNKLVEFIIIAVNGIRFN